MNYKDWQIIMWSLHLVCGDTNMGGLQLLVFNKTNKIGDTKRTIFSVDFHTKFHLH